MKPLIVNICIFLYSILNTIRLEYLGLYDIKTYDKLSVICTFLLFAMLFCGKVTMLLLRLSIFNIGLISILALKEFLFNANDNLPSDWVIMMPFLLVAVTVHHIPWITKLTKYKEDAANGKPGHNRESG
jgi:hypothetical protein